jgi:GNAT superfamily N-acetyltransferase
MKEAVAHADFTIAVAGENDADLVAIMVDQLLREVSQWREPLSDEDIHRVCRELLGEDGRFQALLAFDQHRRPVGVMTLNEAVALYANGRFGIIMELYVVPDARSAGVGERLVAEALRIGEERGWSLLEVNVPDGPEWHRTRAFYDREGFTDAGRFLKREL